MSLTTQTDAEGKGTTEFGIPIDYSFSRAASDEQIRRAAAALEKHNISVHVVATAGEAREYVNSILPKDQSIYTSPSETLRLSGLEGDINDSGRYVSVRAEVSKLNPQTQRDEMRKLIASPDVVVGSVHAVTEDGRLIAASASGSQLGAYSAGAGRAIFVVGSQKIVPDLESGLRRIEQYAYPKEDIRARAKYGRPSALAKIFIMNMDWPVGRSTVVLIREPIGF